MVILILGVHSNGHIWEIRNVKLLYTKTAIAFNGTDRKSARLVNFWLTYRCEYKFFVVLYEDHFHKIQQALWPNGQNNDLKILLFLKYSGVTFKV